MAQDELMRVAARLGTSADALAALAAFVRIETEGLDADPRARAILADIAGELLGGEAPPDAAGAAPVVGMARAFLLQASELVESPGRSGAWDHVDERLLQGVGRLSMAIVDAIRIAEGELDGLADRLGTPGGAFLDIGTGTGWLAIAMARTHPNTRVVGVDLFEPALAIARGNVRAERLDGQVELVLQDAADLDDDAAYDAIWVALPFLPKDLVPRILERGARALRPGGWLLPGTFAGQGDRLSELLMDLRTVRAGGHPWQGEELIPELDALGLADAHEVPRRWAAPLRLYAGRKPAV